MLLATDATDAGLPEPRRWSFAATSETHASVYAAARVMDVDVLPVDRDDRGRLTGAALRAAIEDRKHIRRVVARRSVRRGRQRGDHQRRRGRRPGRDRRRVRGTRSVDARRRRLRRGSAVCPVGCRRAARVRPADSFGRRSAQVAVRPLRLRGARLPRSPARCAVRMRSTGRTSTSSIATSGTRATTRSSCRGGRAGLPLWFRSRHPRHGGPTTAAVERTLDVARAFAAEVAARDDVELILEPQLSVVLFPLQWMDRTRLPLVDNRPCPRRSRARRADELAGRAVLPGVRRQSPHHARPPRRRARRHGSVPPLTHGPPPPTPGEPDP